MCSERGKGDGDGNSLGALRGRVDLFKREDNVKTPHLNVRVLDQTDQPWRIAVNVESEDTFDVVYWIVDPSSDAPSRTTPTPCPPDSPPSPPSRATP